MDIWTLALTRSRTKLITNQNGYSKEDIGALLQTFSRILNSQITGVYQLTIGGYRAVFKVRRERRQRPETELNKTVIRPVLYLPDRLGED